MHHPISGSIASPLISEGPTVFPSEARSRTPEGVMHLKASGGLDDAPPGTMAWFDVPGRKTAGVTIAFGHWSQLGYLRRPNVISLDTGCVWGGCLSALRLSAGGDHELLQVKCEQAQAPGE